VKIILDKYFNHLLSFLIASIFIIRICINYINANEYKYGMYIIIFSILTIIGFLLLYKSGKWYRLVYFLGTVSIIILCLNNSLKGVANLIDGISHIVFVILISISIFNTYKTKFLIFHLALVIVLIFQVGLILSSNKDLIVLAKNLNHINLGLYLIILIRKCYANEDEKYMVIFFSVKSTLGIISFLMKQPHFF
jgi:hypothetical protein